jgi:hypothetical protein
VTLRDGRFQVEFCVIVILATSTGFGSSGSNGLLDPDRNFVITVCYYDNNAVEISCDSPFNLIHVQDTTWWITRGRGSCEGSLGYKCS